MPPGADTPGVSDDTVTISFIITDTSAVAAAFGWETPDEGDREAQLAALIDHFNANGGFAGREIEAKVTVFNAITDGPVAEEALCNAVTQDDKAFAVVMTGQFQENARPCYRNANTLMLDATLYPVDNAGFEELAPYYWSPLLPSYDDLVAGLAEGLIEDGWFDGATLGVLAIESGLSDRVYEQQFLPRLEAAGVEVASYNNIDPTDSTSLNNDLLQATINFKEAGVDKVAAIGGSRLISFFIDTSRTQNYSPAYALTSYDSPEFNVSNYSELMGGASGISVLPGYDVGDDQHPFPASDAEQECLDVFTAAGLEFEERNHVRTGLMFCDTLRLCGQPHRLSGCQRAGRDRGGLAARRQLRAGIGLRGGVHRGKLRRRRRLPALPIRPRMRVHGPRRRSGGLRRLNGRRSDRWTPSARDGPATPAC